MNFIEIAREYPSASEPCVSPFDEMFYSDKYKTTLYATIENSDGPEKCPTCGIILQKAEYGFINRRCVSYRKYCIACSYQWIPCGEGFRDEGDR